VWVAAKNSTLAWRLRRSVLWRYYRPQSALARREIEFYRDLIDPSEPGCIIDIGANLGNKTEIFLQLATRVIAIEPDPFSASSLRKRFRWKPVDVLELAISSESGSATLYRFVDTSGYNTLSTDWAAAMVDGTNHQRIKLPKPTSTNVRSETLANILRKSPPAKYIKIDVEGFEDRVLSTLTVPVPLISMEFNLPQMWEALDACVARLCHIDPGYRFNFALSEPPVEFASNWIPGDHIIPSIRATGRLYIELYARSPAR
jgi:FkbM family methyltransferase